MRPRTRQAGRWSACAWDCHTGEPTIHEEGYVESMSCARLALYGGQRGAYLLSETTRALLGSGLPEGVSVFPLGQRHSGASTSPSVCSRSRSTTSTGRRTRRDLLPRCQPRLARRARPRHRARLRGSRYPPRRRYPAAGASFRSPMPANRRPGHRSVPLWTRSQSSPRSATRLTPASSRPREEGPCQGRDTAGVAEP